MLNSDQRKKHHEIQKVEYAFSGKSVRLNGISYTKLEALRTRIVAILREMSTRQQAVKLARIKARKPEIRAILRQRQQEAKRDQALEKAPKKEILEASEEFLPNIEKTEILGISV